MPEVKEVVLEPAGGKDVTLEPAGEKEVILEPAAAEDRPAEGTAVTLKRGPPSVGDLLPAPVDLAPKRPPPKKMPLPPKLPHLSSC